MEADAVFFGSVFKSSSMCAIMLNTFAVSFALLAVEAVAAVAVAMATVDWVRVGVVSAGAMDVVGPG